MDLRDKPQTDIKLDYKWFLALGAGLTMWVLMIAGAYQIGELLGVIQ